MAVFIVLLDSSYSYFKKRIEGTKLTFNVGTLNYELECVDLENCEVVIPANSSEVFNVNLTSLNKIDTKYELFYEVISSDANFLNGGHIKTNDELTYLIDGNSTKNIPLVLNNSSDTPITVKLGVIPSLKSDSAELKDTQVSLNKEAYQKFYVYDYSGDYETFVAEADGYYKLEAWGAQGGNVATASGGKGAYTSGTIELQEDTTFYIYVGETGSNENIGTMRFNGGGNGAWDEPEHYATGGGATDFRLVVGSWDSFDSLKSRIMVASGGGAAGDRGVGYGGSYGGPGGKTVGIDAYNIFNVYDSSGNTYGYSYGTGGTQTEGGKVVKITGTGNDYWVHKNSLFGTPSNAQRETNVISSGGGGGYYAGGGGSHAGGGGGSSFISGHDGCDAIVETSTEDNIIHTGQANHYSGKTFSNTLMIAGNEEMPTNDLISTQTGNSGDGYARITFLGRDIYTIKYDANGGSGTMQDDTVLEYATIKLSKNNFTKEGYSFLGWSLDSDSNEVIYIDQAEITSLADLGEEVTLYAVWGDEFIVTLDANGGFMGDYNEVSSGYASSITLGEGVSIPDYRGEVLSLKQNQKYLLQFNYKSDGNNTFNVDFYPDDLPEVIVNATTNLQTYNWIVSSSSSNMGSSRIRFFNNKIIPNPYNIYISGINLYECNNCTLTSSHSITYGSTYGNLPTPTRTGYTFDGWYTATSGGTKITSTSSFLENKNQTLYARWTVNSYVVTLDANGGFMGDYNEVSSGYASSITLGEGVSIPDYRGEVLSLKQNQKYLLQFNYKSDGNNTFNVDFYPDDLPEVIVNATTNLQTYNWIVSSSSSNMGSSRIRFFNNKIIPNPYNIYISGVKLYECTNCTLTNRNSVTYGSNYGSLPTPTRTGYTFEGWYTSASGGTKITSTSIVSIESNQTLYAQWTANRVYVYNYGNEAIFTGGFSIKNRLAAINPSATGWTGIPTIVANSNNLQISIPNQSSDAGSYGNMCGMWHTINKIDLTNYSKLYALVDITFGNTYARLSQISMANIRVEGDGLNLYNSTVLADYTRYNEEGSLLQKIVELDISSITGAHYISFYLTRDLAYTQYPNNNMDFKIYSVWLE